jgi:YD repeat-containing protein
MKIKDYKMYNGIKKIIPIALIFTSFTSISNDKDVNPPLTPTQDNASLVSQKKLAQLEKENPATKDKKNDKGGVEVSVIAIPGDGDDGGGSGPSEDAVNNDIPTRLNAKKSITPETTDLIGEEIDLASGTIGFSNVDVSLPGNSSIDVSIRRRFVGGSDNYWADFSFGNWQLDIPRIESSRIAKYGDWANGRECSGDLSPYKASWGGVMIDEWAYWNGVSLHVPGKTQDKVLNNYGNITSSVSHPLITKSNWRISCIDRKNSQGVKIGEGFVAQSPDGLTYTFSQPRLVRKSPLKASPNAPYYKSLMLVTKVENRFGHSATYHYDSAGKLTSISASDGRTISLTYKSMQYGSTVISTVVANNRTWSYQYSGGYGGRSLYRVTRPDTKQWTYNLSSFNKVTAQDVD